MHIILITTSTIDDISETIKNNHTDIKIILIIFSLKHNATAHAMVINITHPSKKTLDSMHLHTEQTATNAVASIYLYVLSLLLRAR